VYKKFISGKITFTLFEMLSINNSSVTKFLVLFCVPALLFASGSFDAATLVIV
tara:strand:+ start:89 stop:247 length:159 start_codon:yes stop_codon:yes gene_type:complete